MKPKTFLLSAIILHFLVRTFWNFHFLIPEDTNSNFQGTNIYLLGISCVFLLWALYSKQLVNHPPNETEQSDLRTINNTWMFFITSDVMKEVAHTSGNATLQWWFFNPTVKHIEEYTLWTIACAYVYFKLVYQKSRSN